MISIVIPTFNESEKIEATINNLLRDTDKGNIKEVIVADGGSKDGTVYIAKKSFARTILIVGKNRAAQLNAGAAVATGNIFFFLHADSVLSVGFSKKIIDAVNSKHHSGCFRLSFDYHHWFLKANAWFTRFNVNAVRFGDQGLFVTKEVFEKGGGYNEKLYVMEDQEIIHRLKKFSSFVVLDDYVITSARKYLRKGIYKTQATFLVIWLLYYLGASQQRLIKLHRKLLG